MIEKPAFPRCSGALRAMFLTGTCVTLMAAVPGGSVLAEEVRLEVDYEVGKRYLIETKQDMEMTLEIAGQKLGTTNQITQVMAVEVTPREAEGGGKVMTISYRSIKMDSQAMGQRMSYDSAKPEDKDSPLAAGFAAVLAGKTVLEFNQAGEVVAFSSPDGPAGDLVTQEQVQQMVNIGVNNGLPAEPVSVGESWDVSQTTDLGQMGSIAIEAEYKLDSVAEKDGVKLAYVSMYGQMTGGTASEDSPLPMSFGEGGKLGGSMKLDLDGKSIIEAVHDFECVMEVGSQKMPAKIRSEQRLLGVEEL